MNFAHHAIRASLATYLSAMFAVLSFALVKIDFTNYEVVGLAFSSQRLCLESLPTDSFALSCAP